jgi:hypothetical protein
MPPFSFWFTGPALAAFIALAGTVPLLGYGWYTAAHREWQEAIKKEADNKKAEQDRRAVLIRRLTQTYIVDRGDDISPRMQAGLDLPPSAWLNQQLQEMGETWRMP